MPSLYIMLICNSVFARDCHLGKFIFKKKRGFFFFFAISVMESKHGSESNKHPSPSKDDNNSINEDDALSPLISVDSERESESEADVDININENTPGSDKKSISSNHASSSSSKSSSDFFQMDAKMLDISSTFPASSPKVEEDSQSPKEKEKNDKPGDMSSKSEDHDDISPIDANSQVPHAISNPTSQTMSPVQLPPRQVMERSGNYDPDRIPASVFGSRPSSAMEWSAASNDSLFSLNIGNSSFSREQFLMMSGDMSGEDVNKSGELYNSGELNKPGEANASMLPPLSPIGKLRKIRTMDKDKETMGVDKKPTQTKATDEDVSDHFEKVKHELDGKGDSSMINRLSDGSSTSCQSFAFPMQVSFSF